jgi:hypothetical protein
LKKGIILLKKYLLNLLNWNVKNWENLLKPQISER